MAWRLEGTYIETCSCETPCPCSVSFALGADLDYCRIVLGFNIGDGDVDGVDVDGVGAALVVDSPKMIISDAVDMSVEDVVPFGAENGEPAQLTNIRHLAGSTLTISKPTRAEVDAFGIVYEGHSGLSKSDFAWSG